MFDFLMGVTPGRKNNNTSKTEGPGWANPQRLSGTWVQAEGDKGRGGQTRNNGRFRHMAWGAETIVRVLRRSGVDNVHVERVPRQERR